LYLAIIAVAEQPIHSDASGLEVVEQQLSHRSVEFVAIAMRCGLSHVVDEVGSQGGPVAVFFLRTCYPTARLPMRANMILATWNCAGTPL
jgi:hypothetical protein